MRPGSCGLGLGLVLVPPASAAGPAPHVPAAACDAPPPPPSRGEVRCVQVQQAVYASGKAPNLAALARGAAALSDAGHDPATKTDMRLSLELHFPQVTAPPSTPKTASGAGLCRSGVLPV